MISFPDQSSQLGDSLNFPESSKVKKREALSNVIFRITRSTEKIRLKQERLLELNFKYQLKMKELEIKREERISDKLRSERAYHTRSTKWFLDEQAPGEPFVKSRLNDGKITKLNRIALLTDGIEAEGLFPRVVTNRWTQGHRINRSANETRNTTTDAISSEKEGSARLGRRRQQAGKSGERVGSLSANDEVMERRIASAPSSKSRDNNSDSEHDKGLSISTDAAQVKCRSAGSAQIKCRSAGSGPDMKNDSSTERPDKSKGIDEFESQKPRSELVVEINEKNEIIEPKETARTRHYNSQDKIKLNQEETLHQEEALSNSKKPPAYKQTPPAIPQQLTSKLSRTESKHLLLKNMEDSKRLHLAKLLRVANEWTESSAAYIPVDSSSRHLCSTRKKKQANERTRIITRYFREKREMEKMNTSSLPTIGNSDRRKTTNETRKLNIAKELQRSQTVPLLNNLSSVRDRKKGQPGRYV